MSKEKQLIIDILMDDQTSFLQLYSHKIRKLIEEDIPGKSYMTRYFNNPENLLPGDVLLLLGCKTVLSRKQLALHTNNIVIHPSKLPQGRGSAALMWEILKGKNEAWITMFEADEHIDRGDIYLQEKITFDGYELYDEIRDIQVRKTIELIIKYLKEYPNNKRHPQTGATSYYKKRTPEDSQLDVDASIREQFNLLRTCGNSTHPAFFEIGGHRYYFFISKKMDVTL